MAAFFDSLVLLVLPENCYHEFFLKFNFFHGPCWKVLISRVLGYGIVAGSTLVKLPQMLKIFTAGSVEGLSLVSFLLELLSVTISMTYNIANRYPFSTWGEMFFISVQCALLIAMYLYYTGKYPAAAMFLPIYATVAYALSSGFTPMIVLTNLQVTTIPVMATSKVFQIMANYKNGHTGQLSAITTFMNFAGTLARIFTTIQEVDDALILFSFVCSTLLNGILAFQVIMYWKVKVSDEKKEK